MQDGPSMSKIPLSSRSTEEKILILLLTFQIDAHALLQRASSHKNLSTTILDLLPVLIPTLINIYHLNNQSK